VAQIQSVSQTAYNQIGYGVLFRTFQRDGRFPQRKQDIPPVIVEHVGRQLRVPETTLDFYNWTGRTAKRHRVHIRTFLGFRLGTVKDAAEAISWLTAYALENDERHADRLKDAVYEHYRNLKIAPPPPVSIERIIRSAVRTADETVQVKVLGKLPAAVRERLDTLVKESRQEGASTLLSTLKDEPGAATLENVLSEIAKLESLRSLAIPEGLFAGITRKRLLRYKQRVAVEDLFEIRRHPPRVRYSILAAFCIVRTEEITDTLVELLISVIHKMGSRAKHIVNKEIIRDIKRVQGKNKLLYEVAQASIEEPEGTVKDVIYPVAPEQTLHNLVAEYKQGGLYEQRIQTIMRGSYSNHYRRMVPPVLRTLAFCATNNTSKPIIEALDLMRKYANKNTVFYPEDEIIPLEGVVKSDELETIQQGQRVNRINYELCVLKVAREKIRCKEIYSIGANRYRNPDEDLPQDFSEKRTDYYKELSLPLNADVFIAQQKREMKQALEECDRILPKNNKVLITKKNGRPWIKLTPLDPQPEPANLTGLKVEVGRRWNQLYLLDMLKEADLRIGFSAFLKSPTPHEILPREILQRRLLLCLFGLGTNAGIKRVASGAQTESYRELYYVLHRYVSKDGLRTAIAEIANAVIRERNTAIWGEATSLASDSKKIGAWDQNLMTEWHIRYRGPGIMIYWYVEKKALCIYSQIKRCSSSEVAAMIEGVLRHETDMEVQKNYVDSHGQDEAAFAFCHLLGFQLLPRLKGIGRQRLYHTVILSR
jgi:hypothetical protein